jgi:hypothetical protein
MGRKLPVEVRRESFRQSTTKRIKSHLRSLGAHLNSLEHLLGIGLLPDPLANRLCLRADNVLSPPLLPSFRIAHARARRVIHRPPALVPQHRVRVLRARERRFHLRLGCRRLPVVQAPAIARSGGDR